MAIRTFLRLAGVMALLLVAAAGCARKAGSLQPWPLDNDPIVFTDNFTGRVDFQAFGNSKLDALGTDTFEQYDGTSCLKITVPGPGSYAGGAFVAKNGLKNTERDLSGYDALTFFAKASKAVTVSEVGFGNDNTGRSRYGVTTRSLAVTTTWKKYTIPIPDPSRLTNEGGLFYFSAAPQAGAGYTLWFDDVKFERLGTITNPRPVMTEQTLNWFIGSTLGVKGTRTTFFVDGADRVVEHSASYFGYASTNPAVATAADGVISIHTAGTANISAALGSMPVTGAVTLTAVPFTPGMAPTPTVSAGSTISLFSDAYSNAAVDTWSATWDNADVTEFSVFGNNLKQYTNLSFAGIEFISQQVDATTMTHLHMDVLVPAGNFFKIKLVDFGANARFSGGDDSAHELIFNAISIPPVVNGAWIEFDIPFTTFAGLANRAHLAQLILSGDLSTRTVYVDNIYLHR